MSETLLIGLGAVCVLLILLATVKPRGGSNPRPAATPPAESQDSSNGENEITPPVPTTHSPDRTAVTQ